MNGTLITGIAEATTRPDMTGTYLNYLWISLAVVVVVCALIWLGWRNRKRRQQQIPAPAEIPAALLEAEPEAAAEGMIIGTVKAGDYLDRVAVHQLGLRTHGRIELHTEATTPGMAIFRAGAGNVFIPAADLTTARTGSGMVGKFVERDGVILLGWTLGETAVETGFRPRRAEEGRALLQALQATGISTVEGETTA
ncbi:hypothetical protein M3B43_02265 [Nesterenkonia massiliensis]|uniref:PH domain-containing protein n=1 Tax=Nesterenkonia massiliensis TaxID=1232429 RepID=A0ABT2HNA7_9MICC|nr:hypothetical protein [Nesterenkonia massiliensis]MCT1606167.1 hypothetical protein [Nesterenkonia massiliensis]